MQTERTQHEYSPKTGGFLAPLCGICLSAAVQAQPSPQQCRQLTQEVALITGKVRELQSQLITAVPGAKARLVALRSLSLSIEKDIELIEAVR